MCHLLQKTSGYTNLYDTSGNTQFANACIEIAAFINLSTLIAHKPNYMQICLIMDSIREAFNLQKSFKVTFCFEYG